MLSVYFRPLSSKCTVRKVKQKLSKVSYLSKIQIFPSKEKALFGVLGVLPTYLEMNVRRNTNEFYFYLGGWTIDHKVS